MEPIITVATSVYNTGKYLERCLNSITNQTFKDIEIIVVNDGSTDGGLETIKRFEKKDDRIIVFDIENRGVSNARNLGMKNAKGKYIIFVDSDDYLEPDMLAVLYAEITNTDSDMAVCNLKRVFEGYSEPPFLKMPDQRVINMTKCDIKMISRTLSGEISFGLCVSNKLYNVDFLKRTNILFEERDIIYAEDGFFHFKTLKHMKRICVVNKVLYNYYQRSTSVSYTYKERLAKRCANFICGIEEYYKDMDLEKALANRSFIFLIEILYNDIYHNKGYGVFKKELKNKFFRVKTVATEVKLLSQNQKIIYFLYRIKMHVLLYILFYFSYKGVGLRYDYGACKKDI